jgi:hypothetical protein
VTSCSPVAVYHRLPSGLKNKPSKMQAANKALCTTGRYFQADSAHENKSYESQLVSKL